MDTQTSSGPSFMDRYLMPIAVLIGAIIIAAAFAFGNGGTPSTGGAAQPAGSVTADIKNVKMDDSPVIGDPSAPVAMAYWYDYQCPFCKQFETTSMPEIYDSYIKEGKVKIVLKDFQFLGPDSDTAALFARAVWHMYPDKFYDWYKAMFAAQDDENGGAFGDLASIKTLTAGVDGMDVDALVKDMNDNKAQYQAAIAANRAEGQAMGINGTPSMLIGTTLLSGAQPAAAVKQVIDAELAK